MRLSEIRSLESDVLAVIQKVHGFKYKMATENYRQLTNNLQYTLSTLRTMVNVEESIGRDPYASYSNPLQQKRVIRNRDGTTRVVNVSEIPKTGAGWEAAFDESLLLNPPNFLIPPTSVTSLKKS